MRALSPLLIVVAAATGCASEVAAPGCSEGEVCADGNQPPRLFVDPPFGLGYDCVTIGCDNERRLLVENRGGGVIKLALARLSIDSSTDFSLRRADDIALPFDEATVVEIAANAPLELLVRYLPSDGDEDQGQVTLDWYDGRLDFDDAVLTHVELPLSTRALGNVTATAQSSRLNFGFVPVGGLGSQEIVIKNDGAGGVLLVGPISLADGTPATFLEPVAGDWAAQFVNPGEEARFAVDFRPDVAGVFVGSLLVRTNDGAHPALTVEVAGTAIGEPRASLSTTALDFQSLRVGSSRTVDFQVRNDGGLPLTVQASVSGAGLAVQPDPQTLAPLESATFSAVWTPVQGGAFAGQIVLTTNDPTAPQLAVGAAGRADAPALSASAAGVDFGGVVQGWTTGAGTFLITNAGFGDLTINTISFDVGSSTQIRFAEVPALPLKLAPGDAPIAISVFLEATTLGSTNSVVLVGSDSVDTGLGSGGVTRLNVVARVITCEEGCPTTHGTPSCGTGSCQIGSCESRFHDANNGVGDGCECGEDLVPAGGGTRRDIEGVCGGTNLGELHDDGSPNSAVVSGTLHDERDVDLFFFRARDDSEFFSDSYGAVVELVSGPPGLLLFARFARDGAGCGGENQRQGGARRYDGGGSGIGDDSQDVTVWVEWAPGAAPQCGLYTVVVRADDG